MKTVTIDRWRDAVKFLAGLGVGPHLTSADQQELKKLMDCGAKYQRSYTLEQAGELLAQRWIRT